MSSPAIAFDVGGVLAEDLWQHVYFDVPDGIATRCTLSSQELLSLGQDLFAQYAVRKPTGVTAVELEVEYWLAFLDRAGPMSGGFASPEELIALSRRFIRPIAGMNDVLEELHTAGRVLAICSNNTAFWFQATFEALELNKYFDPRNCILSCEVGALKSSPTGEMFAAVTAALVKEPEDCLLVDDKASNVHAARCSGLKAVLFTGASELRRCLEQLTV